jgi:hypothetical protein
MAVNHATTASATADEALADCKRRFKNLPDRHFSSVETLIRQHFRTNPQIKLGEQMVPNLPIRRRST